MRRITPTILFHLPEDDKFSFIYEENLSKLSNHLNIAAATEKKIKRFLNQIQKNVTIAITQSKSEQSKS